MECQGGLVIWADNVCENVIHGKDKDPLRQAGTRMRQLGNIMNDLMGSNWSLHLSRIGWRLTCTLLPEIILIYL